MGRCWPRRRTSGDMEQIVTNSTVDGVLAAFFAVLIIVIIADAMRVWSGIIRGRRPLETTEVPAQPSHLFAPSGLIATPAEREEMARAGGSGRFGREEHEPIEAGSR
jgi:carbon starvation protein